MALTFHTEEINFRLNNEDEIGRTIEKLIVLEGFEPGDINIIFCSDNYLLEVNREYLKHDYFTDIITFSYNEDRMISGDLFISIDRVTENAETVKALFNNELKRVIVHGILHLVGYNDKTNNEISQMRSREDFYLG